MSDRIVLTGMLFEGRHGHTDEERELPQPFSVDLELRLDLRPAGRADDLTLTVDYGEVFERCRQVVEQRSYGLLEAIAEALAQEVLAHTVVDSLFVRVRKLAVPIAGVIEHSAVEIERFRETPLGE